jgi:very-short-patch-repair endonuclease
MRNTKNYMSLPYNPALKERARALRRAGYRAEVLLWNRLKRKQFYGLDFDRQKIIGNYIVDFYCAEKQAVVEVDGSSHDNKVEYDRKRDADLEGFGLTVIHLRDSDVKFGMEKVLEFLRNHPVFGVVGAEKRPPRPKGTPAKKNHPAQRAPLQRRGSEE